MVNKKLRNTIIAVSLIAVVGIGGTLAYLSDRTEEKKNIFTMGEGLTGELKEPSWDGDNFSGDNEITVPTELGMNQAISFTPGRVIKKDPAIANTSTQTSAYVGVTITYEEVSTWAELSTFAEIDWNTADWTFNSDYTNAVLKESLPAGAKTPTLFNTVTIKKSAVADESKADANHPLMKDFNIVLNGYLVQSENTGTAANALNAEFPDFF